MPRYVVKAGHCAGCARPVWRTTVQQVDRNGAVAGTPLLLWPMPDSLYSQEWTPTGHTVGIAWCAACAPEIGSPGATGEAVIGYESARSRYAAWFAEDRRDFLRAHLSDQVGLDETERDRWLAQWDADAGRMA